MKLKYNPIFVFDEGQVNSIKVSCEGQKVGISYFDETDTFDFAGLPDGMLSQDGIRTTLPFNPIVSAEKKDGVLWLEVMQFISEKASEEERFPEWQEVSEEDGNHKLDV